MGNLSESNVRKSGKTILFALSGIFAFGGASHAKFDGFYAGGSVGYLQQNTNINAQQDPTDPNAHVNNTQSQQGLPTAEVFLGWGTVFGECFYGGVEGKIDVVMRGSKKVAEDTAFIFMSNRKGPGAAALVRLGYLITPQTMIYGAVGVKAATFEHNIFEKLDIISAPFSKRAVHLLTEIGIETTSNIFQNLAFRFSYSFMTKKSMIGKIMVFPANHMYQANGIFKTETTEHAIKAGVVYRF